MKFSKFKTLFLAVWTLSACLLFAGVNENAGTTGFASLKNVHSARAIAMGQALTGEAGSPDGLHFNPASIIKMQANEVGSTYTSSFVGSQGGQIQYLWPKNRFTAWGFALKYMNMGSIERTEMDQHGNLVSTGEYFGANNLVASASLAKYISDMVDVGGTVKVVYDQIDDRNAVAAMLDVGLMHHPVNEKLKVGASVRNLGFQLKKYSETSGREDLPLTFAAGVSFQFNPQAMGNFEIGKATGENIVAKLGVEYEPHPALDIRAGFRSNASDGYTGGTLALLSGFSLGAGWKWKNYRVDYGVASYGGLGLLNQLSLSMTLP